MYEPFTSPPAQKARPSPFKMIKLLDGVASYICNIVSISLRHHLYPCSCCRTSSCGCKISIMPLFKAFRARGLLSVSMRAFWLFVVLTKGYVVFYLSAVHAEVSLAMRAAKSCTQTASNFTLQDSLLLQRQLQLVVLVHQEHLPSLQPKNSYIETSLVQHVPIGLQSCF